MDNKPLTVKELDPEDQPREKAEKYGCGVLSVPDLWALILRTGVPGVPITRLCREMMHQNDGRLHNLERRSRKELRSIKGIGDTKSIQIEAVMELMRRYAAEEPYRERPIVSSQQIFDRLKYNIGNLPHEEIWLLLVNRRNMVIKEICLSKGTSTASLFDVKATIRHALLEQAEGLILAHNHPSGGTQPSESDNKITRELLEACRFMRLRFLDHVIVTSAAYYSYHDSGNIL
ncbi:MAG: DNA repair protein RadC [Bacteroides sp.]|nr:DNA repair protein RadC [Bacteroides sp.]